ncbi:MAG TPA: acetoacetate decarboxylase family protein [Acidimicrobiia bacterium]|nr:acetoacetate decarboxylase family protein [Acidimicrobiia bacterium]
MSGFLFPRTPSGRSSLLPPPPWHYSGEMLTVEYRADPARVAELLPEGVDPAADDPGAVALIWADWQSCGDSFEEVIDPVRSQYKECFAVVRCQWEGETWSRCVYIWVDKDFALVRGYHQGYPKKLGSIWMTRPITTGRAGPRLEPGGRFGATLAAGDRRLAQALVELKEPATGPGFVNGHAMLHNRWWPTIESDGTESLDELVTMRGYDGEIGDVWAGEAELELFDSPNEELSLLAAREIIGGYYHRVGVSWNGGTTLRRTMPMEVENT